MPFSPRDRIADGVILVTGANGGLGREFVRQTLARGASKVYAAARRPGEWEDPRVVAVPLDVTDFDAVAKSADRMSDVTYVINNAGVEFGGALATTALDDVRSLFDTNFFGALAVASAYAPVLRGHGGGVLLNVLSYLSWHGSGNAYSASKAALWSASNSLRLELDPDGILVVGVHLGPTATPMTPEARGRRLNDPADVVDQTLDGVDAGNYEILCDEISTHTKKKLAGSIQEMYPELA